MNAWHVNLRTGSNSLVVGTNNTCNHDDCLVIGTGLTTTMHGQVLIGNNKNVQSGAITPEDLREFKEILLQISGGVARQAEQSVPVVGEVVAWKADNGQWSPSKKDAEVYTRRMGKVMHPLVVQPTHFVSTAELERLRKDAERLQYMLDEAAIIMCAVGTTSTMYRLEWPLTGYVQTDFHKSEREAIDAAIAAEEKER